MARNQRQLAVLAVLLAVLAAVFVYRFWASPSDAAAGTSNVTASRTAARAGQSGQPAPPPAVRLDALKGERPTPVSGERNLFRFKPKPLPPAPSPTGGAATGGASPGKPPVTMGPPPPPPIPLKFIGVVESADRSHKIAVLSDGRAAPQYGKEGDIILGQYKILRIGVESIEMAYLDGRGRQTIRLTGQ